MSRRTGGRAGTATRLILLACLLWPQFALAADPRGQVSLELTLDTRSAQCPDRAALQARVQACLSPQARESETSLSGEVRVTEVGDSLEGRLRMVANGAVVGERRLMGARDCDALVSAAALAMCIALDAIQATQVAPAPPSPPLLPQAATATQPEIAGAPTPWLGLGVVGSWWAAPAFAPGFTLAAGLDWPQLAVALEGRVDMEASVAADGGQVRTRLTTLSALGCGQHTGHAVCLALSGGQRRLEAVGFGPAVSSDLPYFAAGLRAGTRWRPLASLRVGLWAELAWPFSRDRAVLTETDGQGAPVGERVTWTSAPFALSALLRVALIQDAP